MLSKQTNYNVGIYLRLSKDDGISGTTFDEHPNGNIVNSRA